MNKKFPFEDFTLIMTRNCNLACEYCPLEHFEGNMSGEILDLFFENIIKYKGYNLYITLFGGEPLLNKIGIEHIYNILNNNKNSFINNNINITLKIVTNGTLLNKDYIVLLEMLNLFDFIKLVINISIDGSKETQLRQRNYKLGYIDYYSNFKRNIHILLSSDIDVELGMVMSFFNEDIFSDVVFLINEFRIPVFLMPVDLTLKYIVNDRINIYTNIRKYLINIEKTLKLIEISNLTSYIVNYNNEYRDIKIPPIGPTIDIYGDIYTTRDFLFTMDKSIEFVPIGNIKDINMTDYFINNNIYDIEQKTLKLYYGKTFSINKKIGDYFTKLVYKK